MDTLRHLRLAAALGAAGLAATVALAGCGAGGRSERGDGDAVAPVGPAQQVAPGRQNPQAQPGGQPAQAPADLRVQQRTIIYTGSITVRVTDVDQAATNAISIATAAGGFVGADKRTNKDRKSRASIELRVPAEKFTSVVDQLAALGTQEQRDIDTKDVTEDTLDLDARIATQRARVDSGRRLLAKAKTLDDLIKLEGELAKRESDLAALEAKQRHLKDLAALSTITAMLLGPEPQPARNKPERGFLAGVKSGWSAFVASFQVLLTVLGALLPWIIAIGVPVWIVVWLVRRLRRDREPVPARAAPPATGRGQPPMPSPMRPAPEATAASPHGTAADPVSTGTVNVPTTRDAPAE